MSSASWKPVCFRRRRRRRPSRSNGVQHRPIWRLDQSHVVSISCLSFGRGSRESNGRSGSTHFSCRSKYVRQGSSQRLLAHRSKPGTAPSTRRPSRVRDGSGCRPARSTTVEVAALLSGKSAMPCRTAEAAALVVGGRLLKIWRRSATHSPRTRGAALRQAEDVTERDFVPWVRAAFLAKLRLAFDAGSPS